MTDAGSVAGLRGLGLIASLGFSLLLARDTGGQGAGTYFISVTLVLITAVIARLGSDSALVRLISGHRHNGVLVVATARAAIRFTTVLSVAATGGLLLLAPLLSDELFQDSTITTPLRIVSLAIPPTALTSVFGRCLIGAHRVLVGVAIEGAALPIAQLILYVTLLRRWGVSGAATSLVVANMLVLGVGIAVWARSTATHDRPAKNQVLEAKRLLIQASLPLLGSNLIRTVLAYTGTLVLGVFSTSSAAGVYAICARIARVGVLPLSSLNTAVAPRLAAFHADHATTELRDITRRALTASAVLATCVNVPLIAAAPLLLRTFGGEFAGATATLRILLVASAIDMATGPVAMFLQMTERERALLHVSMLTFVTQVAIAAALTPVFDANGPASAEVISQLLFNALVMILVVRYFRDANAGSPDVHRS
ncbi:MAG: oligosaccharide flippase family protein [Ilumatobacteraceae bacterium]|nr:oligosaccharide flippase family protein [Ilumatobacteraceae bacterium]